MIKQNNHVKRVLGIHPFTLPEVGQVFVTISSATFTHGEDGLRERTFERFVISNVTDAEEVAYQLVGQSQLLPNNYYRVSLKRQFMGGVLSRELSKSVYNIRIREELVLYFKNVQNLNTKAKYVMRLAVGYWFLNLFLTPFRWFGKKMKGK